MTGPQDPSAFNAGALGVMGCWGSLMLAPWSRETSAVPPGSAERRGVNVRARVLSDGVGLERVSLGKELPKSSSTVICFTTE